MGEAPEGWDVVSALCPATCQAHLCTGPCPLSQKALTQAHGEGMNAYLARTHFCSHTPLGTT